MWAFAANRKTIAVRGHVKRQRWPGRSGAGLGWLDAHCEDPPRRYFFPFVAVGTSGLRLQRRRRRGVEWERRLVGGWAAVDFQQRWMLARASTGMTSEGVAGVRISSVNQRARPMSFPFPGF